MAEPSEQRKASAVPWAMIEPWAAPLLIAIAVLAFYAIPLTDPGASVQWDAADVHYPLQRYFGQHLLLGQLPYWTPYLFSGYPLLANPEMAAWYLPNWPFFLSANLHSIQFELALHGLLACLGAYFFFRETVGRSSAAVLGAFAYGLSGFFAGHSSHLPVFFAAAWFPWVLWSYRRAADSGSWGKVALGGLVAGAMILAGHLPAAIFGLIGLAWYVLADIRWDPPGWLRFVGNAWAIVVLSVAISCVQLLPAIELIQRSWLGTDYSQETLKLGSLMTLVVPNAIGTISMKDRGLITNHYLYAGVLLLPMALIGLRNRRAAWAAFVLIVPAVWYMAGAAGRLYRLGAAIPAMQSLGPPSIAWFLPAFGLAWLAACGSQRLFQRVPKVGILCAVLFFSDLWYWNLYRNPLAFAHGTGGTYSEDIARVLAAPQLALSRFDSRRPIVGAGPRLFPLDVKLETTTGYLVLQPAVYHDYSTAMAGNPRLGDGLNVGRYLDPATGQVETNDTMLPRAYFPRSVVGVSSEAESLNALAKLDPAEQSTVLAPNYFLRQDPKADQFVIAFDEGSYRVHYTSRTPGLLKLSVPWYPGWSAQVGGRKLPVLRVDHALVGVVVPPGEGVVEFSFRPTRFRMGCFIAGLTAVFMFVMSFAQPLWARLTMRSV